MMNTVNNADVKLNESGQIDVDFYISKAHALRSQAITQQAAKLVEKVKGLLTPTDTVIVNAKAA